MLVYGVLRAGPLVSYAEPSSDAYAMIVVYI